MRGYEPTLVSMCGCYVRINTYICFYMKISTYICFYARIKTYIGFNGWLLCEDINLHWFQCLVAMRGYKPTLVSMAGCYARIRTYISFNVWLLCENKHLHLFLYEDINLHLFVCEDKNLHWFQWLVAMWGYKPTLVSMAGCYARI